MAGKVRRVDWSPDEWLSGTRGVLTITELAVYDVVLNMIYSRGGRAPNDERFIAGHFKAEGNKAQARSALTMYTRRALDQLVALGKLRLSPDGLWLSNGRADVELGKAGERIVGAARAGVASGAARRAARSGRRKASTPPSSPPATHPAPSQSSRINDLARTSVRNHQPPILTDLSNSTDAARADRPATEGPPARAPDNTAGAPPATPSSSSTRVAELAKERREQQRSKTAKPSKTDQQLAELARKFHEEKR